ncbi:MAG: cyclic nucleotide-binding domain-containing protein [Acidobacteriota bacterium]|nr:cyclic nucleotide-binding domain-containing protein [Acidobacteriota bacterium]
MALDPLILNEVVHLQSLSPSEKAALAERMDLMRYQAGQIVFEYGDPGHALFIVRLGEVEIYIKNNQGDKIVLEVSRPGDVFGEISLLDGGPRTASVVALLETELLRVDREHFEDYVRLYTPAALNLLSAAARRLRTSSEHIRRSQIRNANDVSAEQETWLTRLAEAVPSVAGSVPSVALHALVVFFWIALNLRLVAGIRPWDPPPFSLLADIVSIYAMLLTIFVLVSQNRQRARDRIRSDIEFETGVNTELKIADLHEKIDQLLDAAAAKSTRPSSA